MDVVAVAEPVQLLRVDLPYLGLCHLTFGFLLLLSSLYVPDHGNVIVRIFTTGESFSPLLIFGKFLSDFESDFLDVRKLHHLLLLFHCFLFLDKTKFGGLGFEPGRR